MVAEIAQLNAKREEMIRKEVEKIQNESKMMMERYLEECKRRTEMIQKEEEMRVQQEREQKELMKQRMLEHEQKERARKEELKRQEELLTQKHLRAGKISLFSPLFLTAEESYIEVMYHYNFFLKLQHFRTPFLRGLLLDFFSKICTPKNVNFDSIFEKMSFLDELTLRQFKSVPIDLGKM